jgi:hypothetical protein
LKQALLLNLLGGLLMLLLVWLASHITAVWPSASLLASEQSFGRAPTTTYFTYLPLMSVSEKPTARTTSITPLSTTVPRYTKFEVAFAISTTATNVYFPYDLATPYNERGVTVDMLITSPNGITKTVPFLLSARRCQPHAVGPSDWRCRYSPESLGRGNTVFGCSIRSGNLKATYTFNVIASSQHGFVRQPHRSALL